MFQVPYLPIDPECRPTTSRHRINRSQAGQHRLHLRPSRPRFAAPAADRILKVAQSRWIAKARADERVSWALFTAYIPSDAPLELISHKMFPLRRRAR